MCSPFSEIKGIDDQTLNQVFLFFGPEGPSQPVDNQHAGIDIDGGLIIVKKGVHFYFCKVRPSKSICGSLFVQQYFNTIVFFLGTS